LDKHADKIDFLIISEAQSTDRGRTGRLEVFQPLSTCVTNYG
jgi:hypothetical protein